MAPINTPSSPQANTPNMLSPHTDTPFTDTQLRPPNTTVLFPRPGRLFFSGMVEDFALLGSSLEDKEVPVDPGVPIALFMEGLNPY